METATTSRRVFLKGSGLAAALVVARRAFSDAPKAARPNVVLILTDDQGYGDLSCLGNPGCRGNPILKTPNLDRLHGESVRFTDFHVSPTCAPTRASLMTGRYNNATGVWHTIMGRSLLRRNEVTMADVFASSGYRTGIFGKWHLGDNYPFRPQDRGFQETLIHGGGGVGQTPDYWGNDYEGDTYLLNGTPKHFDGYCTDVWFDGAMAFMEANTERPFFCYIPTNAPHAPYNVPQRYVEPYANTDAPNPAFYGMIANIDENVGRLEAKLRELNLRDNTILIFMTDNGTSGGIDKDRGFNAGMRATKGSEYDGGHRVPCFIRWPDGDLGGGIDIDRLAAHIDVLPTLIELCGLNKPESVVFHGSSLVPLLREPAAQWPDRTLCVDSQRIEHPEKWRKSAVMTQQWRLVNGKELYDIKADPGQKVDVAAQHADTVAELRAAYERWWADTSKRFDEYCWIVLGSDKENPVRLTCHDWHAPDVPWNQTHIREGKPLNGFWAVDVERAGAYEFELRRWPREADAPITGTVPGGTAIQATQARMTIGDAEATQPIPPDAKAVTFSLELKAGQTHLQTWFTDDADESRGAYYVYVRRI